MSNQPTHEAVARRAQQIWKNYGSPAERDNEIWLEAERQLHAEAETAPSNPSAPKSHQSSPPSEQPAVKATQQAKAARAPIVAHHTGPKAKPPETGKPLWNQPHSS